jgi:glycosyltransferase involved in cell wall biosynthesis
VKPGDLNDLTNAMRMILDDRVEAFKMGQNGRQAIIEKFNWDSEEKKYLELFHKLKQLKLRNMNSNKN